MERQARYESRELFVRVFLMPPRNSPTGDVCQFAAIDVQERQLDGRCQSLIQSQGRRAKPQSQGEGSASWKLVCLVLTLTEARLAWSEDTIILSHPWSLL